MANRHVLLVGASGGIGFEITQTLLTTGFRITGTSTTTEKANTLPVNPNLFSFELDVTDRDAVFSLVERVYDLGCPLDGLIYCSGIVVDRPFYVMNESDWKRVIDVNLSGAFNVAQAVAKRLMTGKGGFLIFIGSVSGQIGNPGQANYSASKAGLIGLSKTLAVELGPYGITSNVVAPGPIETPMTREIPPPRLERIRKRIPLRRFGSCKDVAGVVAFLASEEAGYITGQSIIVDGGLTVS